MNRVTSAAVVVAALCVLVSVPAQAQPYWNAWVEGGWTRATLNPTSKLLNDFSSINGFAGGVQAQVRLWDAFGLGIGVRYVQKGGKGEIDSTFSIPNYKNVTETIGSAEVTVDEIEIPIVFAYIFDVGANSWVRAYFGPNIGIILKAHLTGERDGQAIDDDIGSYVQNAEYAYMFGASYNYDMTKFSLLVDYRYTAGLSDVTEGDDIKTQTNELLVGIGIRWGHYD